MGFVQVGNDEKKSPGNKITTFVVLYKDFIKR